MRIVGALVDVRGHVAVTQGISELHAQEVAGRVARHARVIAFHQSLDHLAVGIEDFGGDGEVFIIDDGVHLLAERAQAGLDDRTDLLDIRERLDRQPLEIDEEGVLLRVVAEAFLEGHTQKVIAQAHRLGREDARVHQAWRCAHDRGETHLRQNVPFEVDSGCDFDELQALFTQREHAALGDVEHRLLARGSIFAAEGAMLDFVDEFRRGAFFQNPELAVLDRHVEVTGVERADEHRLLRVLADVDEAAGAGQLGPELADVQIAFAVGLGEAEEGDVQTASIVEIELVRLVDDGLGVGRGTEVESAGRHAADHAGLGGQRDEIDDLFLVGDVGDAFRHADPEVHDAVRLDLERGAARDDLALVHLHRRNRPHRHLDLAGERGTVRFDEGLPMVLGLGDDHAVDQDARYLDLAGIERAALGDPLDLRNHDTAGIARSHGDRQSFQRQRFLLHREIAVGVRRGGADDSDVDRKGPVVEVFPAVDRHQLNQLLGCARVELAAAETGIDESAQAHSRKVSGLAGGDVAIEMADDALRQVVCLDGIGDGEPLDLRQERPVPADHAPHEAFVPEMIEALVLPVALPGRIDQCQVARFADRLQELLLGGQEQLLQGDDDFLGNAYPDEASGRHRVAVADQPHGIHGRHDLAVLGGLECSQQRMGGSRRHLG